MNLRPQMVKIRVIFFILLSKTCVCLCFSKPEILHTCDQLEIYRNTDFGHFHFYRLKFFQCLKKHIFIFLNENLHDFNT